MAIWTKLKIASFCIQNCMIIQISGRLKTWTFTSEGYERVKSVNNLNFSFDNKTKYPIRIKRVTGPSSRLNCQNLHLILEDHLVTQNHTPWTFAIIFSEIQNLYIAKNKVIDIKVLISTLIYIFGNENLIQIAKMFKKP